MFKFICLLSFSLVIFSCSQGKNDSTNESSKELNEETKTIDNKTIIEAEEWLKSAIEGFFGENQSYEIFTEDYTNYKADATAVGYDDGLTEEEFNKKWESKFNTKYAGLGVGFLISAQDWNEILVKKCTFKKQEDGILYFDVILTDIEFKEEEYKREIHVQNKNNKFLIADVLEF